MSVDTLLGTVTGVKDDSPSSSGSWARNIRPDLQSPKMEQVGWTKVGQQQKGFSLSLVLELPVLLNVVDGAILQQDPTCVCSIDRL